MLGKENNPKNAFANTREQRMQELFLILEVCSNHFTDRFHKLYYTPFMYTQPTKNLDTIEKFLSLVKWYHERVSA